MNTDELKRLMGEATPGPWTHASDKLAAGNIKAPDNARLIVAAVNALPELLAENERLREALTPFALVAEHDIGSDETDRDIFRPMLAHNHAPRLSVGDLRRARAALGDTP